VNNGISRLFKLKDDKIKPTNEVIEILKNLVGENNIKMN
jgi:hypothetical protein